MNEVHPYITEGIGEDFVPQNYEMQYVDVFEQVTDKEAADHGQPHRQGRRIVLRI